MKLFKIVALLFIAFLSANNLSAQDSKSKANAEKQLEELNTKITTVNPALALTQLQKDKILPLYIKRADDIKAVKAQGLTPEEQDAKISEIRKVVGMEINKNILTKEQKEAKSSAEKKE